LTLKVNTHRTAQRALGHEPEGLQQPCATFQLIESGQPIDPSLLPNTASNQDLTLVGTSPTFRHVARNALTGISALEEAKGATNDVSDLLKRGRELALQSAGSAISARERSSIDNEFKALRGEVARIAAATEFEGLHLTDGSMTALELQVGLGNTRSDRMTLELGDLTATSLGFFPAGAPPIGLGNTTAAHTAIAVIDIALQSVSRYRADFGQVQNRIESTLGTLQLYTRGLRGTLDPIENHYHASVTAQATKVFMFHHPQQAEKAQAEQIHRSTLRLV